MMRSPSVIRAVVFDLDGTMFNTEDLYDLVSDELLRPHGHRFTPEVKRKMMGRPGSTSLQIMIDHYGIDSTVELLQQASDVAFARILPTDLALMPGLSPLLQALEAAAIPIGLATSSRRAFMENALRRFSLEPHFQFTLAAEDVTHGKPAPEIYLTAARLLGVAPEHMLVLEDSENGCRAAVAAGAHVVAVPNAHTREHDFAGVAHIAHTLADPYIYRVLGLEKSE